MQPMLRTNSKVVEGHTDEGGGVQQQQTSRRGSFHGAAAASSFYSMASSIVSETPYNRHASGDHHHHHQRRRSSFKSIGGYNNNNNDSCSWKSSFRRGESRRLSVSMHDGRRLSFISMTTENFRDEGYSTEEYDENDDEDEMFFRNTDRDDHDDDDDGYSQGGGQEEYLSSQRHLQQQDPTCRKVAARPDEKYWPHGAADNEAPSRLLTDLKGSGNNNYANSYLQPLAGDSPSGGDQPLELSTYHSGKSRQHHVSSGPRPGAYSTTGRGPGSVPVWVLSQSSSYSDDDSQSGTSLDSNEFQGPSTVPLEMRGTSNDFDWSIFSNMESEEQEPQQQEQDQEEGVYEQEATVRRIGDDDEPSSKSSRHSEDCARLPFPVVVGFLFVLCVSVGISVVWVVRIAQGNETTLDEPIGTVSQPLPMAPSSPPPPTPPKTISHPKEWLLACFQRNFNEETLKYLKDNFEEINQIFEEKYEKDPLWNSIGANTAGRGTMETCSNRVMSFLWLALDYFRQRNEGSVYNGTELELSTVHARNRYALAAGYFGFLGKNYEWNWLSHEDECLWKNVECDSKGNVIAVSLKDVADERVKLIGKESTVLHDFVGLLLEPDFFALTSLERIDFPRSDFVHIIPTYIGLCTSLTSINLSGNQLDGNIPTEIGLLTNLRLLDLSSNDLTGIVPSELTNIPELALLNVRSNFIQEEIPSELCDYMPETTIHADCSICPEECCENHEDCG